MINNLEISKLFTVDYLFDKNPPVITALPYVAGAFVLLIVVAVLGWLIYRKKSDNLPFYRRLQSKFFNSFFYTGIFGLLLTFFSWQQIAYLDSRFFFIILGAFFLGSLISLIIYRTVQLPKELDAYQLRQNFEKYLPKNSKGKI